MLARQFVDHPMCNSPHDPHLLGRWHYWDRLARERERQMRR